MKRLTLLTLLLVAALLLAACGGGGDGGNGGAEAVSLTFEGNDSLQFNPATASAAAGAEVTVTLNNSGALEHSWVLVPDTADVVTVTEADAVAGATTGVVAGGQSGTVTFTAPAAGTYKYVCAVPGHAAGGMVGTLTVQ
ncbi:MAG: plastocyanin/azurin family copper-binding protein [Chloroflexi bacterium]|nr:plastocyanin/azurin family copper-binding protein [Chloroflexota bacterium]MCI0576741.1 plastocyanin/azurin family copper-binding protein [Chloroflexota bacterium]MCI0645997.1 plastocyanin/azurin family copper-binding protein [Chloroflexota bacterium]MCI0726854.1 plastocyanin/azurin family copper-binding protein [Chloroflexota bacterium]